MTAVTGTGSQCPVFTIPEDTGSSPWTLVSQGAEARVWKQDSVICKERFPKRYRHPTLDERLTKTRCRMEARILQKCAKNNNSSKECLVAVPKVIRTDKSLIYMEFVEGEPVRNVIDQLTSATTACSNAATTTTATSAAAELATLSQQLGRTLAHLHNQGIVHGDLTTSNMILRPITDNNGDNRTANGELVLIDFGLAKHSNAVEEKAVDLYVLERALASTHATLGPEFWESVLGAYAKNEQTLTNGSSKQDTLARLEQVRQRGRKPPALAPMVNNLFKTAYYKLEKTVASGSIPKLVNPNDRLIITDDSSSEPVGETFDHSIWDGILKEIVSTGATFGDVKDCNAVNYAGLASDNKQLQAYLEQLANAKVESLSPREQLALWMNAYNALCVSVIIEHGKVGESSMVSSITEIKDDTYPVVWDRPAGIVGGESLSLNAIEHDKLRNAFAVPEVHACIVCASASCPDLRREAFTGSAVIQQMQDQTRQWLRNPTKGCGLVDGKLTLSRIFLWFQEDFGGLEGAKDFCAKYVEDGDTKAALLKKEKVILPLGDSIRYFEYNWKMNCKP